MVDIGSTKIKNLGETHVEKWLTENGYTSLFRENLQMENTGLMANGKIENIIVQISTFLLPHRPFKISEYEADRLIRRAKKLARIAYAAYVVVDEHGNLDGEIIWERLS
ncbi:MAG: hypothetical protein WAU23_14285 [Ferruginibacter sp.]